MNVDMLRVAGTGVTLILTTVPRCHVADDQTGGGLVPPVWDDHGTSSLPALIDQSHQHVMQSYLS